MSATVYHFDMAAGDFAAAASGIADELNRRLRDAAGNDQQLTGPEEAREAKSALDAAIVELQILKSQTITEEQAVRSGFADRSANAQNNNHTVMKLLTGKKSIGGKLRAEERRSITQQKTDVLAGYRKAKLVIDDALRQAKALRTRVVTEGRSVSSMTRRPTTDREQSLPAPAAASRRPEPLAPLPKAVFVSAGWIADPMGRHQHRYWDGTVWTHHVADNGVQSTDAP
jgi:hypothetical protein